MTHLIVQYGANSKGDRNGLEADSDGEVYPKIQFTMSSMQIPEDTGTHVLDAAHPPQ